MFMYATTAADVLARLLLCEILLIVPDLSLCPNKHAFSGITSKRLSVCDNECVAGLFLQNEKFGSKAVVRG